MSITRTKKSHKQTAFLFVGMAALLLIVAAPALVTDFLLLSGNPIHDALLAEEKVSDEDLSSFVQSRKSALEWHATKDIYSDLAMAVFEQAKRKGLPATPETRLDLEEAISWQTKSLSLSPADTYGWSRLAYLYILTTGISNEAATALEHSIEAAPYEPRLMLSRVTMAVLLDDKIDSDTKAHLPQMIRESWALSPQDLVYSARQGHFTSIVEAALTDTPDNLEKFQKMLGTTAN